MNIDSGRGPTRLGPITDVGVVMFGASMQLRYANDEARSYMARAINTDVVLSHKEDLGLAIVKLGVHVRNRGTAETGTVPDGVLTTLTASTQQGLFRLHALEVLDPYEHDKQAGQQIMIVIEDCRKERSPSTKTLAP